MFLANQLRKIARTPFAGENLMAHEVGEKDQ
jgi:hypothetical protein